MSTGSKRASKSTCDAGVRCKRTLRHASAIAWLDRFRIYLFPNPPTPVRREGPVVSFDTYENVVWKKSKSGESWMATGKRDFRKGERKVPGKKIKIYEGLRISHLGEFDKQLT